LPTKKILTLKGEAERKESGGKAKDWQIGRMQFFWFDVFE